MLAKWKQHHLVAMATGGAYTCMSNLLAPDLGFCAIKRKGDGAIWGLAPIPM